MNDAFGDRHQEQRPVLRSQPRTRTRTDQPPSIPTATTRLARIDTARSDSTLDDTKEVTARG